MSVHAEQLPLDLGHRTAMGRADFLIAPSNQDAVAWIDLWPEWPAPALVLYGPVASGKSHLAAVWCDQSGAAKIPASDVSEKNVQEIAARAQHIMIDDADRLIGDVSCENALFHLYNIFKEEKRSMLLTMQDAPIRRAFALPDLASRLRAAPCVAIREPDDALMSAILVKLFNDRQLRVSAEAINYIVPRVERSFEAVSLLVQKLDEAALSSKSDLTIPFIRKWID
jgi:DnaA regulatory inactivator Hda